ncbi:MAG: ATPase [Sphingobacteriales bacterium]|nr:MAG: ATPase [Sphingobacteriales bacterium]
MEKVKKIVIVGPESTGKSTICAQLAGHFNTTWVAEYAREYLLKNGTDYKVEDLLTIAKGQLALEEQGEARLMSDSNNTGKLLFIDTNMYVMQVWSEFVFGKCDSWILEQIVKRPYDLYMLCNTDLPWIKDELREYPDMESRSRLFHIYKQILSSQEVPWVEITGGYDERLQTAINAVHSQFPHRVK